MAMSEPLFMAILSMDSYNRDYKQGINVDSTTIGKADLLPSELPTGYEAASFFAQAYKWNDQR